MIPQPRLTIFLCNPWESYIQTLIVQCEQQRREEERELDLQRELELYPPTETQGPDIIPVGIIEGWDAYR